VVVEVEQAEALAEVEDRVEVVAVLPEDQVLLDREITVEESAVVVAVLEELDKLTVVLVMPVVQEEQD